MIPMIMEPITVPIAVPIPPAIEVPPMIAVIASNSFPSRCGRLRGIHSSHKQRARDRDENGVNQIGENNHISIADTRGARGFFIAADRVHVFPKTHLGKDYPGDHTDQYHDDNRPRQ